MTTTTPKFKRGEHTDPRLSRDLEGRALEDTIRDVALRLMDMDEIESEKKSLGKSRQPTPEAVGRSKGMRSFLIDNMDEHQMLRQYVAILDDYGVPTGDKEELSAKKRFLHLLLDPIAEGGQALIYRAVLDDKNLNNYRSLWEHILAIDLAEEKKNKEEKILIGEIAKKEKSISEMEELFGNLQFYLKKYDEAKRGIKQADERNKDLDEVKKELKQTKVWLKAPLEDVQAYRSGLNEVIEDFDKTLDDLHYEANLLNFWKKDINGIVKRKVELEDLIKTTRKKSKKEIRQREYDVLSKWFKEQEVFTKPGGYWGTLMNKIIAEESKLPKYEKFRDNLAKVDRVFEYVRDGMNERDVLTPEQFKSKLTGYKKELEDTIQKETEKIKKIKNSSERLKSDVSEDVEKNQKLARIAKGFNSNVNNFLEHYASQSQDRRDTKKAYRENNVMKYVPSFIIEARKKSIQRLKKARKGRPKGTFVDPFSYDVKAKYERSLKKAGFEYNPEDFKNVVLKLDKNATDNPYKEYNLDSVVFGMLHANILPVIARGVTIMNHPFIVMPLVNSERSMLSKSEQEHFKEHYTVDQLYDLAIQYCDGLDHAHKKGIVQRDVKPGNLLLTETGNEEEFARIDIGRKKQGITEEELKKLDLDERIAKANSRLWGRVTDFGISTWLDKEKEGHTATGTGSLKGTPNFLSPEQATDTKRVTAKSDMYSLGASLYFLLTGETPTQRTSSIGDLIHDAQIIFKNGSDKAYKPESWKLLKRKYANEGHKTIVDYEIERREAAGRYVGKNGALKKQDIKELDYKVETLIAIIAKMMITEKVQGEYTLLDSEGKVECIEKVTASRYNDLLATRDHLVVGRDGGTPIKLGSKEDYRKKVFSGY